MVWDNCDQLILELYTCSSTICFLFFHIFHLPVPDAADTFVHTHRTGNGLILLSVWFPVFFGNTHELVPLAVNGYIGAPLLFPDANLKSVRKCACQCSLLSSSFYCSCNFTSKL